MYSIFDLISGARFAYKAGTGDATITVPAGSQVKSVSVRAPAGSDATMTIAPGGANQVAPATAGDTITILAGSGFSEDFLGAIGGDTVFAITGSGSYYVSYFLPKTGPVPT